MTTNETITTTQKKQVLHVGCGPNYPGALHSMFQTQEWQEIRLDIDESVQPDIVSSIVDMKDAVASGSVDAVWSSHNIEHLFSHEVPVAFAEFWRVLKVGGFVLLNVPNLQKVAEALAQGNSLEDPLYISPIGPICAIDMLYGHRESVRKGSHFMAHKTGFTPQTMVNKLRQAGFTRIGTELEHYNLWAIGYKDSIIPMITQPNKPPA